jgi:hypothetical protein
MNDDLKAQIKEIIRQELAEMVSNDRFIFRRKIRIEEGLNIETGIFVGSCFGTTENDKIGFYGITPVARQAAISEPSGGVTVDAEARSAITAVIGRLQTIGIIK